MKKLDSAVVARIDEQLSHCGTYGDRCSHCDSLQAALEAIWAAVKEALA